jgi:hypothetical protein
MIAAVAKTKSLTAVLIRIPLEDADASLGVRRRRREGQ